MLCCEEAQELLASIAKEVLRLYELLRLSNVFQLQLEVLRSQHCILVSQTSNLVA